MQATQNSLLASNLALDAPSKYEVQNKPTHYRQYVRYCNTRLQLLTPSFQCEGLKLKGEESDYAVLLPVTPWLREQLDIIEKFVQENANVPDMPLDSKCVYKPLWRGNMMYVRVSNWCNVLLQNPTTNSYESVDIKTPFKSGSYTVTIDVSHVYIGPHKNGEHYSLNIRASQIVYLPTTPPSVIPVKTLDVKGRRRGGKHAAKAQEAN